MGIFRLFFLLWSTSLCRQETNRRTLTDRLQECFSGIQARELKLGISSYWREFTLVTWAFVLKCQSWQQSRNLNFNFRPPPPPWIIIKRFVRHKCSSIWQATNGNWSDVAQLSLACIVWSIGEFCGNLRFMFCLFSSFFILFIFLWGLGGCQMFKNVWPHRRNIPLWNVLGVWRWCSRAEVCFNLPLLPHREAGWFGGHPFYRQGLWAC